MTPTKNQLEQMTDYRECAERLLTAADPRALADAARTLAMYVGHYQRRHGVLSFDALLSLSSHETAEQVADISEGMRWLAAVLTVASAVRIDLDAKSSHEADLIKGT